MVPSRARALLLVCGSCGSLRGTVSRTRTFACLRSLIRADLDDACVKAIPPQLLVFMRGRGNTAPFERDRSPPFFPPPTPITRCCGVAYCLTGGFMGLGILIDCCALPGMVAMCNLKYRPNGGNTSVNVVVQVRGRAAIRSRVTHACE